MVDVAIVSTSTDPHVETVGEWLSQRGSSVVTFNLANLRNSQLRVTAEALEIRGDGGWRHVDSSTTVWWHRPGHTIADDLDTDEANLVRDENPHILVGMLDGCGVRWVDHPDRVARAERKLFQLATAHRLGVPIPRYLVTNDPVGARDFVTGRRVVTKALSPGFGIAPFTSEIESKDVNAVAQNPVLLQEFVEAEFDLRVVVVNDHGWVWSRERSPYAIDWREVDPSGSAFVAVERPAVLTLAIELTAALGLSMSIQDWLINDDGPVFLESNAQGAWRFLVASHDSVAPALASHLGDRR